MWQLEAALMCDLSASVGQELAQPCWCWAQVSSTGLSGAQARLGASQVIGRVNLRLGVDVKPDSLLAAPEGRS